MGNLCVDVVGGKISHNVLQRVCESKIFVNVGTNFKGFFIGVDYVFILVEEEYWKNHSLHQLFLSLTDNNFSFVCIDNQEEKGNDGDSQYGNKPNV